ncbi:hypothetical protein PQQ75_32250 [Paraburkholderia aspalathi]|uniref:hypothetical protein n=1 Tax=Paraburkholderia aspalathi TaxID=1324617 RepID=UPI0038B78333
MRADTGLTDRNIARRMKLRSRTLRRAIAGIDLFRFVTRFFPALLINTLHLQIAEEATSLHRNPTGHGILLREARNPAFSISRQQLRVSFSRLFVNSREQGNLPVGCHTPSLTRGSICCVPLMGFLRQWIVLLAPGNRSFCAASTTPLTGSAHDKLNNGKTRDGRIG